MPSDPPRIAILSAMTAEITPIEEALENAESQILANGYYATGTLYGRPVVLSDTGGGKVRAAIGIKMMLEHFKPQALIYIGTAGGLAPDLNLGDVVIAEKLAYHDFGKLSEHGFEPLPSINARTMPIVAVNPLVMTAVDPFVEFALTLAHTEPIDWRLSAGQAAIRIRTGSVVTGDVIVRARDKAEELRRRYAADMVDCESAVVAEIATEYEMPWLVIRAISNIRGGNMDGPGRNLPRNLPLAVEIAAHNAAALTMKIVEKWDDFT